MAGAAQTEVALATPSSDAGVPISLEGVGGGKDGGCSVSRLAPGTFSPRDTSVFVLAVLALCIAGRRRQGVAGALGASSLRRGGSSLA